MADQDSMNWKERAKAVLNTKTTPETTQVSEAQPAQKSETPPGTAQEIIIDPLSESAVVAADYERASNLSDEIINFNQQQMQINQEKDQTITKNDSSTPLSPELKLQQTKEEMKKTKKLDPDASQRWEAVYNYRQAKKGIQAVLEGTAYAA